MNLKENQPELLAEAQRAMVGPAQFRQADSQQEFELWHAPEVYWLVADRSLSIVKTLRTLKKKRQQISRGQEEKSYLRESFVEQSTNFYASNLVLGLVPPLFIHQLGRSRWRIDTEVFQTITPEGHLKQPSVHQQRAQALVVLTMIRVLAYTLMLVFYHRQVRSHFRKTSCGFCELPLRLAYQFLSALPDTT